MRLVSNLIPCGLSSGRLASLTDERRLVRVGPVAEKRELELALALPVNAIELLLAFLHLGRGQGENSA